LKASTASATVRATGTVRANFALREFFVGMSL
jgi:hypothetical protein